MKFIWQEQNKEDRQRRAKSWFSSSSRYKSTPSSSCLYRSCNSLLLWIILWLHRPTSYLLLCCQVIISPQDPLPPIPLNKQWEFINQIHNQKLLAPQLHS